MGREVQMQIRFIILTIINALIMITGQSLWKMGISKVGGLSLKLILEPYVIAGLFCYGVSTILWFYILSKLPFSTAYPLNSITYVLALLVGYFIFKESISAQKMAGTAFILLGVFFIARG